MSRQSNTNCHVCHHWTVFGPLPSPRHHRTIIIAPQCPTVNSSVKPLIIGTARSWPRDCVKVTQKPTESGPNHPNCVTFSSGSHSHPVSHFPFNTHFVSRHFKCSFRVSVWGRKRQQPSYIPTCKTPAESSRILWWCGTLTLTPELCQTDTKWVRHYNGGSQVYFSGHVSYKRHFPYNNSDSGHFLLFQ